ncbi:phosphoglycerate mutase, partial [Candidatus Bathyarchaeota archaeon]|nr:phosphoglycerate mutase [Candidatus Bathyarchaeota archaeon]
MKLIYVVLDGLGDKPSKEWMNRTPLEEAKTPNMDFLARKGKSGLMYTIRKGVAPESDAAIISLLGYDAFKYSTGRGVLEAIGSGLEVNDGDLSLRCNFATLGSNKKIVDRRVGRDLSTKEATELSKAINEEVKLESHPAQLEFKNTIGHRCVVTFKIKGYSLSS